ncbi:MAG: glycosyltransferase family 4 protein [Syntrophobacteraceae bacterium]
MNILTINHYAGSPRHGMEYRPFYLAREWKRSNHRVCIVAASASHLRRVSPRVRGAASYEEINGISYLWVRTPGYKKNDWRRAANMFAFVFALMTNTGRLAGLQPDVVIASSTYPLDNLPAFLIARKSRAKLIYEVHDLWPLSLIELGGMSRAHPFVLLMQWAEGFACKNADLVVSVLPNADRHLVKRGMAPSKFCHIPNGIACEEWESASERLPEIHERALNGLHGQGEFLLGYAGAHGIANGLSTLVEAASLLQSHKVVIVLVGQGPEKEKIQCLARQKGLTNMVFLPPVAKACIPRLLSKMDALYIGLKKSPLFRFGISPNKLMDYMMAGKPIIEAIEASNDMVAWARCGISVPAENPSAVAQAIKDLMCLGEGQRIEMGLRGKRYLRAGNDYKVLAAKFIDYITRRF